MREHLRECGSRTILVRNSRVRRAHRWRFADECSLPFVELRLAESHVQ
jgi:hypothetical protein